MNTEIIRGLERALEGSRELDRQIYWLLSLPRTGDLETVVPNYTTSIDAALTLVPERANWLIGSGGVSDAPQPYRADVHYDKEVGWGNGLANTSALALCVAALKAKEKSSCE